MSEAAAKRVSRKDWCMAGLSVLRDQGHQALTIERVCGLLHKTKGSFYHHFGSLDAYHEAVLAQWEADLTEQPIAIASRESGTKKKAERLDDVVAKLDHRVDRAVRAWALYDERARAAMRRVDERRIGYLAELYRASGRPEPALFAELEYTAFVGGQHLDCFERPEAAARLNQALRAALTAWDGTLPGGKRKRGR